MKADLSGINDLMVGASSENILNTDLSMSEVKEYAMMIGRHAVINRIYRGPNTIGDIKESLEEDYDLLEVRTLVLLEGFTGDKADLKGLSDSEACAGIVIID